MVKNALTRLFDYEANHQSPIKPDFNRVVSVDETGQEFISWLPVDYPSIQKSLSSVQNWTLSSLMKAGIDPKFSINTGLTTRLQGVSVVEQVAAAADVLLSENNNKTE